MSERLEMLSKARAAMVEPGYACEGICQLVSTRTRRSEHATSSSRFSLIDARDRASRFAESGRKATRRMMYSIIIRPEEIGMAKGERRGNRETKKPKVEKIKTITTARSQKTAGW
jgi:hypothetical protein